MFFSHLLPVNCNLNSHIIRIKVCHQQFSCCVVWGFSVSLWKVGQKIIIGKTETKRISKHLIIPVLHIVYHLKSVGRIEFRLVAPMPEQKMQLDVYVSPPANIIGLSVIVRMGRASNLWGGGVIQNPPKIFSSKNMETYQEISFFFGFWAISRKSHFDKSLQTTPIKSFPILPYSIVQWHLTGIARLDHQYLTTQEKALWWSQFVLGWMQRILFPQANSSPWDV